MQIGLQHSAFTIQKFRGVGQIVRFNWPFYALAGPIALAAPWIIAPLAAGIPVRAFLYFVTALTWVWLIGSLAASWLVYDHSPLNDGAWIREAVGFAPRNWIAIHAGFDGMTAWSPVLGSPGRRFDIFDPVEMTEGSLARARAWSGAQNDAEGIDFRHLPELDGTVDAALLVFSAHELRRHASRAALFAEIHRVLGPHGRAVVVEHLRDWPNFIAFGPGVLHFHSRRSWTRAFARARLAILREFSFTPFVRVFVLGRLI